MISHSVKQARIILAQENTAGKKLSWSGLFLNTPTKQDLLDAMDTQILQVTEDHIRQHDGDTQADLGGLKIKVGQIECFKQVITFWKEDQDGCGGTGIWLNGYIKLGEIEVKDMIPLWMNEEPNG